MVSGFPRAGLATLPLDSAAPRAGAHRTGTAPAAPAAKGSFLLRSGRVSSALLPKTQKRSIRTDRSRIKTGLHPDKTRKRLGRRQSKGPPRQQNRFATDVNLWQIGFGRIRCCCPISPNTFTCNMFSWSRLGDLNPGPTHYETAPTHGFAPRDRCLSTTFMTPSEPQTY